MCEMFECKWTFSVEDDVYEMTENEVRYELIRIRKAAGLCDDAQKAVNDYKTKLKK